MKQGSREGEIIHSSQKDILWNQLVLFLMAFLCHVSLCHVSILQRSPCAAYLMSLFPKLCLPYTPKLSVFFSPLPKGALFLYYSKSHSPEWGKALWSRWFYIPKEDIGKQEFGERVFLRLLPRFSLQLGNYRLTKVWSVHPFETEHSSLQPHRAAIKQHPGSTGFCPAEKWFLPPID